MIRAGFASAIGKHSAQTVHRLALPRTGQKPCDNGMLAERLHIHFGVLSDERGIVSRTLARGDLDPGIPPPVATLVLDPGLRVTSVFRAGDGHLQAGQLRAALAVKGRRSAAMELFNPAPILVVPAVLDRAFCQRLRDYFEAGPSRVGARWIISAAPTTRSNQAVRFAGI